MTQPIDSTVDPREVEFYTRMAEAWWDRDGAFWPLHTLNELRVDYIRSVVCRYFGRSATDAKPLAGLRVLDVGCGGGVLSEPMARLGADVTGIDVVEKNIGVATLHAREQNLEIDYRLVPVSDVAAAGERFDIVLNMEVVEHVADLDAFMRDCAAVTAAGGMMFVATINRNFVSWLFAIVGAEYILRLLPRGTHRWGMFRKPAEIERLLEADGLGVSDSVGVRVNPFNRRFRLTPSLAVNYMIVAHRHGKT